MTQPQTAHWLDLTPAAASALPARLLDLRATLRDLALDQPGYGKRIDLVALPWQDFVHLEVLSLRRCKVAAALLGHPHLRTLRLKECEIVGVADVHVGGLMESIELLDCNAEIATLYLDGAALTALTLSQDEDAAESTFGVVRLACPGLQKLRVRSALPLKLVFTGDFPLLHAQGVDLEAEPYPRPTVDVEALTSPSAELRAAAARG
jgi:hypothetical protein